jgi:hypothetical protein
MKIPDKEAGTHDRTIRGSKICSHEGKLFSEGSDICPEGVCSTCKNGRWEAKIGDMELFRAAD